jgi:hypothetical protein
MVTGYLHPGYTESLAEFGILRELPRCGGWILERQIPGFPDRDAMGCYPLFCCQDWSQLRADLEDLGDKLVSLALVTDPFGDYDLVSLQDCFGDVVIPFKEHFVVDLSRSINNIVSSHHRYYARKALKDMQVEVCQEPNRFLDDWMSLFNTLIERHHITGIKAFSKTAFAKQLNLPGLVVFRTVYQDTTVGMNLAFVQGEVVYGHLMAFSELGYKLGAAYASYWSAIEYFADKARWYDIGAVPGTTGKGANGLNQFKQGWATDTRTTYFCGRIFNHKCYADIIATKNVGATTYFPAYRQGEFG